MKVIVYVANRMWLIFIIYLASIFISSMLFSVIEDKTFFDGVWWSFVTSLTIGYGDLSPATVTGKIVGIIFGCFWILLILPMVIANIISGIMIDKNKFTHEEQEWQEFALKQIAAKLNVQIPDTPSDY